MRFDPPGATFTAALGINDTGGIVGWFRDSGSTRHGFFRAPTGAFTTFDVPGAAGTYPQAINHAGQIVGYFTDAKGKRYGFVKRP